MVQLAGTTPDLESLLQRARTAEQRLETREALRLLREVEVHRPDDPDLLLRLARQYSDLSIDLNQPGEQRHAVEQALARARRAADLDPRNPEAALSLAVCYGKLALLSETRERIDLSRRVRSEAERALALDPDNAWGHHLLGRWHLALSDLGSAARLLVRLFYGGLPPASVDDAVRHLGKAVELEPDQLQHHLELGFAWLAHGDRERARSAWRAGLALPAREKHDAPAQARARSELNRLEAEIAGAAPVVQPPPRRNPVASDAPP